MADSEVLGWLRRIDERLERWEGDRDRSLAENLDARAFNDELLRRHAAITEDMIGALAGLQAEILDHRGETRDQRGEIRAQTQAILRLLDERSGPGAPQG